MLDNSFPAQLTNLRDQAFLLLKKDDGQIIAVNREHIISIQFDYKLKFYNNGARPENRLYTVITVGPEGQEYQFENGSDGDRRIRLYVLDMAIQITPEDDSLLHQIVEPLKNKPSTLDIEGNEL